MPPPASQNQTPSRAYPKPGPYPRLDVLPTEDHPEPAIELVEDYEAPPVKPGQFVDPARLSADRVVRWCRACDTVLTRTGQSAFCIPCRKAHDLVLRRRRALANRPVVEISKRHLEQLHAMAEEVRFDLGNLVIAYNHDKRNLDGKMHLVMGHLTELLHHVDQHFEDPRPPSQRRRT